MEFLVPKMAIVVRAFFAILPITLAPLFLAKRTAINALPMPNVAGFFAPTIPVNAPPPILRAPKPKPTNAALAFAKMTSASSVDLPARLVLTMPNVVPGLVTTAFVVPPVARMTFVPWAAL